MPVLNCHGMCYFISGFYYYFLCDIFFFFFVQISLVIHKTTRSGLTLKNKGLLLIGKEYFVNEFLSSVFDLHFGSMPSDDLLYIKYKFFVSLSAYYVEAMAFIKNTN